MCHPAVAIAAMGVSTLLSGISAGQQASARNRQADYNSRVAADNAAIARQEGGYARAQALRNANGKRRETQVLVGAQRARQGASGVVVDSGSASDVVLDTVSHGEREAMALLQQGDVQAWRAETRARGYDRQARLARDSKVSVGGAVAGSLLSSAAKATVQYFALGGFKGGSGGETLADGAIPAENTYTGANPFEPY